METANGFERFSLRDQVFIITGASSGIGLSIAIGMSSVGAIVGLNSRSHQNLKDATKSVPNRFMLPFDVVDLDAAERAIENTIEQSAGSTASYAMQAHVIVVQ